jgi:hypothetical protein
MTFAYMSSSVSTGRFRRSASIARAPEVGTASGASGRGELYAKRHGKLKRSG